MKIAAVGQRLVAQPFDLEGKTKSGLVLPIGKGNYRLGKVVNLGDECCHDLDIACRCEVPPAQVGDSILYTKFIEVTLDQGTVNLVDYENVLAKVSE